MKLFSTIRFISFATGMVMVIFICGISRGYSQEQPKKETKKITKLKIVKEENGKASVLDTTIVSNGEGNQDDIDETFAHLDSGLKELGDDMDVREFDFNIEIPDSAMMDSVKNMVKKIRVLGHGGKGMRYRMKVLPEGFDYNFSIPCEPGCQKHMEACRKMRFNEEEFGRGPRMFQINKHGQTLSDVIGEIPMSRVKSYSIKDKKGGKRIVIELNDAPLIDED